MASAIQQNQVDNRVLASDDPDYIPPGEKSADELELEAQQRQQEEQARQAQQPQRQQDRPIENYEAELRKLREQRDRLRADRENADRERQQLRDELANFRARQDVQREAEERTVRLQREAQRPDPETDPYGAQLYDMQQEIQAQKKLREQWEMQQRQAQQQWSQQQQQQQMLVDIDGYVRGDVARFKDEHPDFDYDGAAKYLLDKYVEFWQSTGLTSQEANAVTANTFLAVGRSAQLRGQSAASAIANLATLTGYNRSAPGAVEQPRPNNAQERIARIDRGQKLQGIGGKTPSERTVAENIGLLTAQQMAEMTDDDYLRMKQDPQQARLLERRLEELG